MKNKSCITTLVLFGLVGFVVLSSSAFGQIPATEGSSSATTEQVQTNLSSSKLPESVKLSEMAIDFKVPINLINNSSKVFWNSPSKIPATIVASVINNGKLILDVSAFTMNSTTKKQEFNFAGQAMPGGDGLILFGKYTQLVITCQNSTTKQYGSGTLEVATLIS